ncbi:unnamed protein product [Diabrotica balteata]|uniref:Secreted protein n=1 Tax=Diabrotica balteata TaxID=107213 RepID=A0A9P0GU14_DIABA|nr:unnamed protein product [Diabrotica balteata]
MAGCFKSIQLPTVLLVLVVAFHNSHSATLTDVLLSDESNKPQEISSDEFIPPPRLSRDVKYPRYAADNTDKDLKPEDSPDRDRDRDNGNAPPGKRCISCFASYPSYSNTPSYDRSRYYYDDRSRDRDYDRYDDRDRYNDRDRYDRYNDRDGTTEVATDTVTEIGTTIPTTMTDMTPTRGTTDMAIGRTIDTTEIDTTLGTPIGA